MSVGANPVSPDDRFGRLRSATEIQEWERNACPHSITILDAALGSELVKFRELSRHVLFRSASQCFQFIWAMDEGCSVHIAYEELVTPDLGEFNRPVKVGHPRRKGYPAHPASEKKLGHPTLLNGGMARIAGELFLDGEGENLHWYVRCQSGRYCVEIPPTRDQEEAIHQLFMELIDDEIRYDPVEG